MPARALSPTSFIVLGLLSQAPGTPYELKARVAATLADFWSVQHAQLYSETARLAQEGLLSEKRESGGLRRKTYSITKAGADALQEWLAGSVSELAELRDLAILKVFFGADPTMIATRPARGPPGQARRVRGPAQERPRGRGPRGHAPGPARRTSARARVRQVLGRRREGRRLGMAIDEPAFRSAKRAVSRPALIFNP